MDKSSYQKLREENNKLLKWYLNENTKVKIYYKALMEIGALRGPDVVEAPLKAMDALIEAQPLYEKE